MVQNFGKKQVIYLFKQNFAEFSEFDDNPSAFLWKFLEYKLPHRPRRSKRISSIANFNRNLDGYHEENEAIPMSPAEA